MLSNYNLKTVLLLLLYINPTLPSFIKIPKIGLSSVINNHNITTINNPKTYCIHPTINSWHPNEQKAFEDIFKNERMEAATQTLKLGHQMVSSNNIWTRFDENYTSICSLNEARSLKDVHQIIQDNKQKIIKKNLGISDAQMYTKESIYKSFKDLLVQSNSINPEISSDFLPEVKEDWQIILNAIKSTEKVIPALQSITSENTHPINRPGSTGPAGEGMPYDIFLSPELPPRESSFILAHEIGHYLNLHSHLKYLAHQNIYDKKVIKKIANIILSNKIDKDLGSLSRLCETEADTHLITTLPTDLAKKITLNGIETIVNSIAYDNLYYQKNPLIYPKKENLTNGDTKSSHPTWPLRLLWLFKAYEILDK